MDKFSKIASEITVRISLAFQDAPDVHTLLAMTPVRERGKLVRLALQRFIEETNHPAGDVDAQIEAVSHWLRNRGSADHTDLPSNGNHSPLRARPGVSIKNQAPDLASRKPPPPQPDNVEAGNVRPVHDIAGQLDSPSLRRWMTD